MKVCWEMEGSTDSASSLLQNPVGRRPLSTVCQWHPRNLHWSLRSMIHSDCLLTPNTSSTMPSSLTSLQLSLLEDAITELRKFEGELQVKASHLASMRLDASQPSSFLSLKGKR